MNNNGQPLQIKTAAQTPKKILNCRMRYQKRKRFRKIIESSALCNTFDERPFANIKILGENVRGLLDSGASVSVLGKNSLQFMERNNILLKSFKTFISTADGSKNSVLGHCTLPVFYKGVEKDIDFYIVPSLNQEAYLGLNFWRSFAIAPNLIPAVESIDFENNSDNKDVCYHDLSAEQKLQLEIVVLEFPSFEKQGLGCTNLVVHHIDTGDSVPIKCKHYPLSPPRQAEVYRELDRLLKMGVIEESNSPWCSPIVNVRKPGKIRLCLDSRKLNLLTKKDSYPLPHINGLLSRLSDTHFISGIDLKDAFFQIPLSESSREKTAFAVPGRPLYQFRVMPFGLCNGPQAMSRLMDKVIPSRLREHVFIYLDDLLVCSATLDEHLNILREVAQCLKNAGLTINVAKSKFCQSEIKYLGYRIGKGCLKVDPEKVSAIVDFPLPKSPRQIRRFIGMCNWYRSFVDNFADMAGPLTNCLKKNDGKFTLTPEAIESFEKLKTAMSTAPVLAQPDFSREFFIQCDASRVGVGGVLFQLDDENRERPIAFVSKKLNRSQRNYTVTELECLAAVVSVKRFRPYIEGLSFRIITDHSSLKWLMSLKDLNGRLARWSLELQGYEFKMEHRKGSLNVVPDALSRFDVDSLDIGSTLPEIDMNSPEFESQEYKKLIATVSDSEDLLPDLRLSDKLVYKRVKFRQGIDNEEESLWRLWLPLSLTKEVIQRAHDSCCHGGYFKTLSKVRQYYYWPAMAKDVKAYVSLCDDCKIMKSSNQVLRPPMGEAFLTARPMQRLYCDFLGPYPCSKSKNSQLFIVLDHFTKFIFLKPLRAATSINVIDFFQNYIFNTFGVPQFIHSDNAKQFVSAEMQEFFSLFGITHIRTGLYSPQANASERVNREIITKIRFYLRDEYHHLNWDTCIPRILSILRSDFHSSIQCSPYYALFGQNMCLHGSSYPLLEKLNMLTDDTIIKRVDKLSSIRDKIAHNLDKAHERATKVYNTRTKNIHYRVGQELFRRNHNLSNFKKGINAKFAPKYIKCRIRGKIGNALYEVEDLQGKLVGRFHASDLKP